MIVETSMNLGLIKMVDLPPTIAAEGEMVFNTATSELLIFVAGEWKPVIKPAPRHQHFSIFLPSLPSHDCVIFKTVLHEDLKFSVDDFVILSDANPNCIEVWVNGIDKISSVVYAKKGDYLTVKFIFDSRQSPGDLSFNFTGVQLTRPI